MIKNGKAISSSRKGIKNVVADFLVAHESLKTRELQDLEAEVSCEARFLGNKGKASFATRVVS